MTGSSSRSSKAITALSGPDSFKPTGPLQPPQTRAGFKPPETRLLSMSASLRDTLPGTPSLRRVAYGVGLVVLFRYLFDFSWVQVVVVAVVVLVAESATLARPLSGVDGRHVQLGLGALAVAAGAVGYWTRTSAGVVAVGLGGGGWLLFDALYSLRAGIEPTDNEDDDLSASDAMLLMQVGSLVTEELKQGPKTVPELAEACDMTESRVRDALELHERAGTAHREGEVWVLDESNLGAWAFVRDNGRRAIARFLRPFRLFLPGRP